MVGLEQGAWLARKNLQVGTVAALSLSVMGVPAGWPFVPNLYAHQYNPQTYWDGGMGWVHVAEQMQQTREELQHVVAGAPESGWKSEDGRAFAERMDRFMADLLSVEIRALLVAAILFMAALLLMALILFMSLITAVMALIALWVAIATITPLSAAAARLQAISALASMNATLTSVEGALNTALHTMAGILGALIVGDVLVEAVQGDFSGVRDFIEGTIAQGPMLIWGTANRVERDATAYGLGGKLPANGFYGWLARGHAGQAVPAGVTQAAGAKGFYETQYNEGGQAFTGGLTPDQNADGSYNFKFPWE